MMFKINNIHSKISHIIFISVFFKIIHYLLIYLSANLLIFNLSGYLNNFHFEDENLTIFNAYKTWDGQIYLFISKNGYIKDSLVNAHYPLYPFLISYLSKLTGLDNLFIGLFISSSFSVLSSVLLYQYVKEKFDEEIALYSTFLFLSFPSSFYSSLIYAESTLILLLLSFFYFRQKNRYIISNIVSFLLPLSRPQGVFIIIPLISNLIFCINKNEFKKTFVLTISCIFGFISYLIIMYYYTGDFFSGFKAQQLYVSKHSINYLLNPADWFYKNFVSNNFALHGLNNSIIDRLFFLFALFTLYHIYNNFDISVFIFSLTLILVPAISDHFTSYPRYLLPVFPMYIVLANSFKSKILYIIILFFSLQIFFIIAHSLNYWIS